MYEVLTTFYFPGGYDDVQSMSLRSELSYLIRSRGLDDTCLTSLKHTGEKSFLILKYLNIIDGQFIQDYVDSYIPSNKVIIYDDQDTEFNVYWLRDALPIIGLGKYKNGRLYCKLSSTDEYQDMRDRVLDRLNALWDSRWMKGIDHMESIWPIKDSKVTIHHDRVMGDFYSFYSNRLRGIRYLKFRIPYNYSIIYHIILNLDGKITMDNGFITVHDVDTFEDVDNIANVLEDALRVKYKTVDYWGSSDTSHIMPPENLKMNIVSITINGYQCHLAKIPNIISVEEARNMISYMIEERKYK